MRNCTSRAAKYHDIQYFLQYLCFLPNTRFTLSSPTTCTWLSGKVWWPHYIGLYMDNINLACILCIRSCLISVSYTVRSNSLTGHEALYDTYSPCDSNNMRWGMLDTALYRHSEVSERDCSSWQWRLSDVSVSYPGHLLPSSIGPRSQTKYVLYTGF